MKFFSGFCLRGEQDFFSEWIQNSDFCIAGFSYGAIKAFEYALKCEERVDTLQIFSPAFFQDRDTKFKKLQILFFSKDQTGYIQEFISNVIYPAKDDIASYVKIDERDALVELLDYRWEKEKLELLKNRGTRIEVYLGAEDKIIHPEVVLDFFLPYSDIYYMKDVGHILR